ncbi:MAG TPA: histidine kinase, partial [Arthrobacter sp.]|nr:histidine kinase [Arthrobacter sp.]
MDRTARTEEAHPRLVDALLAVGMALAVSVVIAADLEGTGQARPAAYLFAVCFGLLMLARRRFPRTILAVTILGIFAYYALGYPPIGISLPAVAAAYSAAEADRTRWAVGAGAVLIAVAAYFRINEGLPTAYLVSYELITNVALIAAAIALGVTVRMRRESRAQQERLNLLTAAQHAREAEQRIHEERLRMARDLHDVIGHTMSVISVHSNVAAEAIGNDDGAASRAIEQIRTAASETMKELRSTVKLLRSPQSDTGRTAMGLDGVEQLLSSARETGLAVDAAITVVPGELSGTIDAAAYRIVQESLTNVIRHARASSVKVAAGVEDGVLRLEIADNGSGSETAASSGHGLIGMRERA